VTRQGRATAEGRAALRLSGSGVMRKAIDTPHVTASGGFLQLVLPAMKG
jgi:hypothetical protein